MRDTIYLSLSYDHRLVGSADVAPYLTAVKAIPEAGHRGEAWLREPGGEDQWPGELLQCPGEP